MYCVLRGILRIHTELFCNAFFSNPYSAQLASMYARSCESWPPQQLITFAFLSSSPKKERAQVNGRSRQCIRYHGKHVCSHTSIHVFTTCARRLRTQSHLDILACMRGCHVCTACAREVARAHIYLRTCADVCTFVRCNARRISHSVQTLKERPALRKAALAAWIRPAANSDNLKSRTKTSGSIAMKSSPRTPLPNNVLAGPSKS